MEGSGRAILTVLSKTLAKNPTKNLIPFGRRGSCPLLDSLFSGIFISVRDKHG
jgi:hypothetical protein